MVQSVGRLVAVGAAIVSLSAPALAASRALPITVEVGLHDQRPGSFLDRALSDHEDTALSDSEVEDALRDRPWLETVTHDGEVRLEVTRRSIAESSRSKPKDGEVTVSWRFTVRATIATRTEHERLEATTTASQAMSEKDASRARHEEYSDRETFERLGAELADQANEWILARIDQLRPDRPDAGFRHQLKSKWLVKGDGLAVTEVLPGSPAARAGLVVGDRIRAIDGEKGTSEMDLRVRTWWIDSGTKATLEVERNKKRILLTCEVLPPDEWQSRSDEKAAAAATATVAPAAASRGDRAPVPVTLAPGMGTDEVQRALGPPLRAVAFGAKAVWTYDGLKVVFVNGKVSEIE